MDKPSENDFKDLDNLFKALNGFDLRSKISEVKENIRKAYQKRLETHPNSREPILLAVSKIKPCSYIAEAYDNGIYHFGENYVQELIEKTKNLHIRCPDIKWHFIGHLQTNKVVKLMTEVPNLYMIETIDSIKLASSINLNCLRINRKLLNVLIQINTSGEENKFGISENGLNALVEYILGNCPYLKLCGFMTIGEFIKRPLSEGRENADFKKLIDLRDRICNDFPQLQKDDIILSMGMSNDYKEAILMGSNEVRIGSALFGER